MQQYMKCLGETVRDKLTDIEGTVTSISFDLYGCVQAIIKQRIDKDGKVPDTKWHDIKRLDIIPGGHIMPVPNYGEMQTENECLQKARAAMKWIKTDTAHKAPEQVTVELLTSYITQLEGALEEEPADNKPRRPGKFPGQ